MGLRIVRIPSYILKVISRAAKESKSVSTRLLPERQSRYSNIYLVLQVFSELTRDVFTVLFVVNDHKALTNVPRVGKKQT